MLRVACDRRKILNICADKVKMREYVAARVGSKYLPEILAINSDPALLPWNSLPSKFVLKSNHGSGFVKIVPEFEKENSQELIETAGNWLKYDYGVISREQAYKNIPKTIMVEEYVDSIIKNELGIPLDYRFFVFEGKVQLITVDDLQLNQFRNIYSPQWEKYDCTLKYPNSLHSIEKPSNLTEMISLAEEVGKEIDHVRVDIYNSTRGPLIGELTMTHGGAMQKFSDFNLDLFLGSKWKMAPFHD